MVFPAWAFAWSVFLVDPHDRSLHGYRRVIFSTDFIFLIWYLVRLIEWSTFYMILYQNRLNRTNFLHEIRFLFFLQYLMVVAIAYCIFTRMASRGSYWYGVRVWTIPEGKRERDFCVRLNGCFSSSTSVYLWYNWFLFLWHSKLFIATIFLCPISISRDLLLFYIDTTYFPLNNI